MKGVTIDRVIVAWLRDRPAQVVRLVSLLNWLKAFRDVLEVVLADPRIPEPLRDCTGRGWVGLSVASLLMDKSQIERALVAANDLTYKEMAKAVGVGGPFYNPFVIERRLTKDQYRSCILSVNKKVCSLFWDWKIEGEVFLEEDEPELLEVFPLYLREKITEDNFILKALMEQYVEVMGGESCLI